MNANKLANSKVNVKKQDDMKTKTSSMLDAERHDEDEDYMYVCSN